MVSHGLSRVSGIPPLNEPDLVTVSKLTPRGVICLISALSFHEITTQIPHEIYVSLEPGAYKRKIEYPPIRTFHFSSKSFAEGIESHMVNGFHLRIYSAERTLADCFMFRNKIGIDTCIEALRLYKKRRDIHLDKIMHHASVCRVSNIMRPYMEIFL